jgi:hypothetical protein
MKTPRIGIHDNCNCSCPKVCKRQQGSACTSISSCGASFHVYHGLTQLWTSIICLKELIVEWHFKKCLMGKCDECGMETFPLCEEEY